MIYAEILAGGKGVRMGATAMPKQFLDLGGRPVLIHTIERFLLHPNLSAVVVVCVRDWLAHTKEILAKHLPPPFLEKVVLVPGGEDRNSSILAGLDAIGARFGISDDDVVLTHDAVRPFLSFRIIQDNIDAALQYGATDTVIPATDTIVVSGNGVVVDEIPVRDRMYQGQTPQAFRIKTFLELQAQLSEAERVALSDAAKIFVLRGHPVHLVRGDVTNMKITTPFDLTVAHYLLQAAGHG